MSDYDSIGLESDYVLDASEDFAPTSVAKKKGSRPLSDSTNTPPSSNSSKKGDASDQYQKLSQLEHILKRPDTYIGSVEKSPVEMWCFDAATENMVYKEVTIVPGLYKIFDEILVNAADNKIRDPTMKNIRVKIDPENNLIQVMNDGRGIPVEIHKKEKMYIPELIFGNLLTSSNYDDNEKKVTGGRNGYGAKLCNIFSTEFVLETADANTDQLYRQTWSDNMATVSKPKITKLKSKKEYTKVTFKPDLAKFNMDSLDDEFLSVLRRRVYDLCGTVKDCNVYLNDKKLNVRNFKSYIEMYVKAIKERSPDPIDPEDNKVYSTLVHEQVNDRWEVGFAVSDGNFNQVSFVNSIATTSGGTHTKYVSDQIITKLIDTVSKKEKGKKKLMIKAQEVRNNMFLFVNCLIENPAFTSQTKEQLTTKVTQFGDKASEKLVITDAFIARILKTSIVDKIKSIANANEDKALQKADGSRKLRVKGQVKLVDANRAGTKDGNKCTLILTEGDSALSLAVAGLAVVGRDYYGCFPLRGKLLNVREASADQVAKNAEINALKQIIGLQHKKHYTSENIKNLRYGHVMIMTDQDQDGSHIKGLLINFFETSFPGLLEIPGFLLEFITPIVKVAIKGRGQGQNKKIPFYTMPEFELWRNTEGRSCRWTQKYYKGLGASTALEAREYFAALDKHLKTFHTLQGDDQMLIDLAFSKKKADERKEWLQGFQPGTHMDPDIPLIPISDFINKELILFSMADNVRSIPSVLDGFKPGQRKVLFGCFKRNLTTEIKVAQLAGYISEHTGYHHGDQSLVQTIIGLAQDFVGSNNLNLLKPNGSFGTRAAGGKDFAASRYIHTELTLITSKIFNPLDNKLYTYVQDDERTVEPEWYLPVIPMLLVNGAEGIGTGWSTNIPSFNPTDLVSNIRRLMNGEELEELVPWYKGWEGDIEVNGSDRFKVKGRIEQIDETTLEITEIPVKMWTNNVKEFLLSGFGTDKVKPWIKDMEEQHGMNIRFVIKLSSEEMAKSLHMGLLERFKLISMINLSNMVAFDPLGKIKKYEAPNDILRDFYFVRLEFYQKRKDHMIEALQTQLTKLSEQARFIKLIIDNQLSVSNKKRAILVETLLGLKFTRFDKEGKIVKDEDSTQGDLFVDEEVIEEEEAEVGDISEINIAGSAVRATGHVPETIFNQYDYLLGMQIWSLTSERYAMLLKQKGDKAAELQVLLRKSAKDLWNEDLDVFLSSWDKFLEDDLIEKSMVIPGAKSSKKRRARAPKSEGPAKKKSTAAKTAVKAESPAPAPKKKVQQSLPVVKKDKSEEEFPSFFSKESTVEGRLGAEKSLDPVVHSIFSDSDDDLLLGISSSLKPALAKPTGRSVPEKVVQRTRPAEIVVDDSDSDIEVTPQPAPVKKKPAPKKASPAAAKKPAPKKSKKAIAMDDELEELGMSPVAPPVGRRAKKAVSYSLEPLGGESSDDVSEQSEEESEEEEAYDDSE